MTRFRGLRLLTPVIIGVGALSAQQTDTTRNPLGNNPTAIAAGQQLYDQTCQSCHAAAGQGDRGPALNTGALARGPEDGGLFRTIREGVPGTQMPPFRGFSDEQIWQLVSYIRSLSASATPVAAPVGGNPAAPGCCTSSTRRMASNMSAYR